MGIYATGNVLLSLPRDVSKFAMHFIVEEIDEDTSMEELQKMMLVALVYRILVCFYEVNCDFYLIAELFVLKVLK